MARLRTGISMVCPECKGKGRISIKRSSFGDRVKARRTKLGMTQEELSRAIRVSRVQIANIEGGRTDIPLKRLGTFAKALKCKPQHLLPE